MNNQPPSKLIASDGGTLLLHSIFQTIQGEGPFVGQRSVFIRLAGCNLQCPGCDTEYTEGAEQVDIYSIIEAVKLKAPINGRPGRLLVVITGGEPFRQNIAPLVAAMLGMGWRVQIETNGTLPPSPGLKPHFNLTVVCSPKTGKVNSLLWPFIDGYKYVARADDLTADGLPVLALGHSASPQLARPHIDFNGPVYLQPMDEKDDDLNAENLDAVVESCLRHNYIVGIQLHKLIGVV